MNSFFRYAKNRFLYKVLKIALLIAIGFIASNFINIGKVYADVVSNTSTNYYYSDNTDVTHTTGFRTNPSTVELFGKDNYAPTYDQYEYLTGFDIYIPYNINEGSVYTVKVTWTVGNWSPDEFIVPNFNARLNGTAIVGAVNGVISAQKTTYFTNNCTTFSGTKYCDYVFTTTYTFTATTTNTAFRVGTYNNSAFSLIGSAHYLTSIASVKEVYVITNNDSTIINQNEQIIDQNKQTNDKLDQAENTRKSIWETIKNLPNAFLNMLKSLIIPDNFDFIYDFKDSLENKLGFIASVPLQFIDYILSLPNKVFTPITSISFPEIEVFGTKFWSGQDIDISEGLSWFQGIKYFGDILCVILMVNTLNKWWKKFGGGNE